MPPKPVNAATRSARPLDAFLDLQVMPNPPWSSSCEGTVWAGERVHVSAQGFLPGTAVSIYSSSPGQTSVEQLIGSARADSKGGVSVDAKVPAGATGFHPGGVSAGLIFLDAIGLGPGGKHADATSMLQMAPPGSLCAQH